MRALRRLLPLVLIACSTAPLSAQELPPAHPGPRSTAAGPEGGTVTALLVDPEDPDRVFAATEGSGVYLSTDGGANWTALLDSPAGIYDVSVETPEGLLHVLREIHRGIDGDLWTAGGRGRIHRLSPAGGSFGGRWSDLSIPNIEDQHTLALDPLSPGVVYAGSFHGVFKWSGSGWGNLPGFPTEPGDPDDPLEVTDLTFDAAGSTLWAGTVDGVYRSADGGQTWQGANAGLPADRVVRALAAAPGVPGRLWAATNTGIFRTTDGGDHWTLLGFTPGFVRHLVADPDNPQRLWATIPGSLEVSGDGGATWSLVTGLPDRVESVALGPQGAGRIYAGSAEGIHRSADGGDTWQPVNRGLYAHQVVDLDARHEAPGRVLAATRRGRLYHSTDSGASWRIVADNVSDVSSSPADPSRVYASTGVNVRRSLDGGLTWQTASSLAPRYMVSVWADPEDPEVVFAAGRESISGGGEYTTSLLRSADGGATWETVWEGGVVEVRDLEFGPGGPGGPGVALFTTTASHRTGVDILRSTDGGVTWEEAAAAGIDQLVSFSDVAADPGRPGRFLGSGFDTGLHETLDAGDSWRRYGFGLPSPAAGPNRLLFDPAAPATVYAAVAGEGGFRSPDGGATWIRAGARTDELRGAHALGLTGEPSTLFAGTDRGVRAIRPDTSPCAADEVTLCLAAGRFELRVQWQDFQGGAGSGHAVPLTADTGAFWFFRDTNLELAVKALDGRGVNGFWWVFYGSLSNVPFTLAVRDTETGAERFYPNLPRTFASRGDTRGFRDAVPAGPPAGGSVLALPAEPHVAVTTAAGTSGGQCPPGDTALCLHGGRFRVVVEWQDFEGGSGFGRIHPLIGDTGAFWFFHPGNLELFVKVLDGRAVNGHWWVFYGSLSNVPFTLTVTDTETGTPRTYENPPRTFASRGDTTAF